jgi:phospholipase C
MKPVIKVLLLILFGSIVGHGQIQKFEHIIVIVQENRTPDNLFQGLCGPPFGSSNRCSTTPGPFQYDIKRHNWLDKNSPSGFIQPTPVALANTYDLGHSHPSFVSMCDPAGAVCKMDGAGDVNCGPAANCPAKPQFKFVSNRNGILNPYLQMATQYGWANYMFQTNQGPSFPAHQFIFGGTSAPTAADDAAGIFASENLGGGIGGLGLVAGCIALTSTTVALIHPPGVENQTIYPCFEHLTMGDLLHGSLTWRYYTPTPGLIWTAPDAIQHICQSTGPGGQCVGPEWKEHVDLVSADVLKDIGNCDLRSVSWVIPTGLNSDHANANDGGGPSWVASIVNAIGSSTKCDNGGYWKNTAIFITWDDWGGWYDHVPPSILPQPQGDYQYGFRVPLLVVSAYTPRNYINNARHDFGSILRFIEHNFGIEEGALNFADKRSQTDLTSFFDLDREPRRFREIGAQRDAAFFLNDKRPATDPDDDDLPKSP